MKKYLLRGTSTGQCTGSVTVAGSSLTCSMILTKNYGKGDALRVGSRFNQRHLLPVTFLRLVNKHLARFIKEFTVSY